MGVIEPKEIKYNVFIGEEKQGETRILRFHTLGDKPLPTKIEEGIGTMWDAFQSSVKRYPDSLMMGQRKKLGKDQYGEFEFKTYKQVYSEVILFATGVELLNLCPIIQSKSNGELRFMGIYSRNRQEWMITDIASHMNSVSLVTLYDTLGDSTIEFILSETGLTSIVMETRNLMKLIQLREENNHHQLQNIIVVDNENTDSISKAKEKGYSIFTFNDILEKGKGQSMQFTHCKPETLATLSYTSGTTGTPKGTMLTHGQLAAEILTLESAGIGFTSKDKYLSYLPLAHVFERVINLFCLYVGATVGFYSGDPLKVVEDAQKLNTTVFIAVPRILQRIQETILDQVKKSSKIEQKLFHRAIKDKLSNLTKYGVMTHSLWDMLVFNRIKKLMGNNCKVLVSAGAPISVDLVQFIKVCFCVNVIEGYGQTESCGAVCISSNEDTVPGHLGGLIKSVEAKLIDVSELNYRSKDINPVTKIPQPRGELCIRGPIVFKEYLNDPKNTKESFDEDGWLHSGDVAIILTNHGNAIKVIDRVKSMFKLSQGEYIAPDKIENTLLKCKYIRQIYITGDSFENYIVGVIVPKIPALIEFLKTKEIEATQENIKDYYQNKQLLNEIIQELDKVGRSNNLKGFELVKKVYISQVPFTIENNLATPTLKLKRNELKQYFAKEIISLYKH